MQVGTQSGGYEIPSTYQFRGVRDLSLGGCGCGGGMGGLGTGFDWGALVNSGFDFAGKLVMTRPGTYVQQGSNIIYRQPDFNQQNLPFAAGTLNATANTGAAITGSTMLLVGAAVLLGVVLLSKRGRD